MASVAIRIIYNENGMQKHWIAVDAPPEHENSCQFVDIAKVWSASGVKVPTVFAFDESRGFMLLEDFGDVLLHPELTEEVLIEQSITAGDSFDIEVLLNEEVGVFTARLLEDEDAFHYFAFSRAIVIE